MIIGLLVCTIGIIPIFLGLSVNSLFKGSKLAFVLLLYMIFITIWQENIGILYFNDQLNEQVILFLFRLFRIGPTFAIPIVFYVAYIIIKKYFITFKDENMLNNILNVVFTKKVFLVLIVWSSIVYMVNWTELGIIGLKTEYVYHSHTIFYFPEYGQWHWLYIFHMSSFILFLFFLFLLSRKILNTSIKKFLSAFSIYSLLLFITGFINFFPSTGIVTSSIGVIIFSVLIMFEFIKLNANMKLKYYQLIERQKKLDYTGHLAGSLIHEVKNTIQIIKGYSQLLEDSVPMKEDEKGFLEMILKATEQMDNLANNYREYMKHSQMEFKMEDIHKIIEQSINFSQEMLKEKQVDIEFANHSSPLKAYVNKTYLQQVFLNLIKNSVAAIPVENEYRKITIRTDLFEDYIVINFYDTGIGIPSENWEYIFDPFVSSSDQGTGFGLPFVKKVIFEHKGDILVMDSTSAGTHFQIKIPQLTSI